MREAQGEEADDEEVWRWCPVRAGAGGWVRPWLLEVVSLRREVLRTVYVWVYVWVYA